MFREFEWLRFFGHLVGCPENDRVSIRIGNWNDYSTALSRALPSRLMRRLPNDALRSAWWEYLLLRTLGEFGGFDFAFDAEGEG